MYIEKINLLINTLVESDYALFDGDKDDALEFIEGLLTTFPDYCNIVVRMQALIPVWKIRCEADEFRTRFTEIDTRRKHCHDACISAVDVLNRLFAQLSLGSFCDIDTSDRHVVANMVGDFVIELYRVGTNTGGLDGATYEVRTEYDHKTPGEVLRQFSEGRCDM